MRKFCASSGCEPLLLDESTRTELRRIDRGQARQILIALTEYAKTGEGDLKRLKGSLDWRLRVGDYRVRFEALPDDVFRILHVRHRRESYR